MPLTDIFKGNFQPLSAVIQSDPLPGLAETIFEKWIFSLGYCTSYKPFPVHIPRAFFPLVRAEFINFLWSYWSRRILYQILLLPKVWGRMGFPKPIKYHQAMHMSRVLNWIKHGALKCCVSLEQDIASLSILTLPWQPSLLLLDVKAPPWLFLEL